jgi:hypothetical protein
MTEPKPKNDKHIELSDDELKKVAGGKMAVKLDPPLTGGDAPDNDPPHSGGTSTE